MAGAASSSPSILFSSSSSLGMSTLGPPSPAPPVHRPCVGQSLISDCDSILRHVCDSSYSKCDAYAPIHKRTFCGSYSRRWRSALALGLLASASSILALWAAVSFVLVIFVRLAHLQKLRKWPVGIVGHNLPALVGHAKGIEGGKHVSPVRGWGAGGAGRGL